MGQGIRLDGGEAEPILVAACKDSVDSGRLTVLAVLSVLCCVRGTVLSAETLAVPPLIMLSFLPLSAALLTRDANSPRPSLFRTAPEPSLASSLYINHELQILVQHPERPGAERGLLVIQCSATRAFTGPSRRRVQWKVSHFA